MLLRMRHMDTSLVHCIPVFNRATSRRSGGFTCVSCSGPATAARMASEAAEPSGVRSANGSAHSTGLLAPNERGDAGRTAVFGCDRALRVDLPVRPHRASVVHRQSALRGDAPFPTPVPDWPITPFLIVSGAGTPLSVHFAPGLLPAFDDSRKTPTYLPSNAVVVGAGACAATGVASMQAAIIPSTIVRSSMLSSLATP